MTGLVTKSIGTSSRDYSTLQAWEDALPANMVSDDNAQLGECYNDSEFTASAQALSISGETTDATRYIMLRPAAGQGFKDHANAQTNALRYNQSNGVGIRSTGNYGVTVAIAVSFTHFIGLQVSRSSGTRVYDNPFADSIVDGCIFQSPTTPFTFGGNSGMIAKNTLIILESSSDIYAFDMRYGLTTAINVTIVRPTGYTVSNSAIRTTAGGTGNIIKNVACFGFTNEVDNASHFTATTCATDKASPMTGFTGSLTYADQFVAPSSGGLDFKAKSGGGLIDTGTTDMTHAANDIVGTARPSGSAYDIGAWELVQAAGTVVGAGLTRGLKLERLKLAA